MPKDNIEVFYRIHIWFILKDIFIRNIELFAILDICQFIDMHARHKWGHAILFSNEAMTKMCPWLQIL